MSKRLSPEDKDAIRAKQMAIKGVGTASAVAILLIPIGFVLARSFNNRKHFRRRR